MGNTVATYGGDSSRTTSAPELIVMKVPVAAAVTPRERRLRPREYSNAEPEKRLLFELVAATETSTWMAGIRLSPTAFSVCLFGSRGSTPDNRLSDSSSSASGIPSIEEQLEEREKLTARLASPVEPESRAAKSERLAVQATENAESGAATADRGLADAQSGAAQAGPRVAEPDEKSGAAEARVAKSGTENCAAQATVEKPDAERGASQASETVDPTASARQQAWEAVSVRVSMSASVSAWE